MEASWVNGQSTCRSLLGERSSQIRTTAGHCPISAMRLLFPAAMLSSTRHSICRDGLQDSNTCSVAEQVRVD
jgi:hypothetical protein